jgi:hypothetical protein
MMLHLPLAAACGETQELTPDPLDPMTNRRKYSSAGR